MTSLKFDYIKIEKKQKAYNSSSTKYWREFHKHTSAN